MNKKQIEQMNSTIMSIIWSEVCSGQMRDLYPIYMKARDNPTKENESFRKKMDDELFPLITKVVQLIASVPNQVNPSEEHLLTLREQVDIGCPICKTRLVFVKRSNYETLNDHVGDPNGYVYKKDAFGCPNESCEAHKDGLKWLADGEGPYGGKFSWEAKYKYIDGNRRAFRTMWRQMDAEQDKIIKLFKIGKFNVKLSHGCKTDLNGKKKFLSDRFHFQLTINGALYTSGIHMLIFVLKQYLRTNYKGGRVYLFKNDISQITYDKRWWKKVGLDIAKVIWSRDYKIALENIKRK